ncbi:MAG: family N-acetyltransferase [Paenibacillaceae bacterium]|jgi:predicted acetyltransferase|nr:family N-acetyltransferase [Paenibacillaceae bacterium]
MVFELKKLSVSDGPDIYEMLQEIPKAENGFINGGHGCTQEEFRQWLARQDAASRGEGLADWMVPSTTYWLYAEGVPVGFAKLRHHLTDRLKEDGGNIGYAVRPSQRNKGYGTILLGKVLDEARRMKLGQVLVTVWPGNQGSINVALKNNGTITRSTEDKHYIWITC